VSVGPLPASPTSGLGSREPPRTETAASASAIPLAALPKDDPPKARAVEATPASSARAKITATKARPATTAKITTAKAKAAATAKTKAKAATTAKNPARQTSTTTGKER
jgi:hypothetical protein